MAMFTAPVILVSACEGDCITGITNALIGNYTTPVNLVFAKIADEIQSRILGPDAGSESDHLLSPIVEEYHKRAYNSMENSIFKTLFHGKCQNPVTGIDPPGCPNPDCPVVCGTPGSLVHFYDKFKDRAFNSTVGQVESIISPTSAAYKRVKKNVEAAVSRSTNRRVRSRVMMRGSSLADSIAGPGLVMRGHEDSVGTTLLGLLRQFRQLMMVACGGTPLETNGLPNCSWEEDFKNYILTFP